jgi:hypothetical protein
VAIQQRNATLAPPPRGPQFDIRARDFSRQNGRQEYAIVCELRLFTDDGHSKAAERTPCEFLHEVHRGHAVTNDDERFAHQ